MAKTPRNSLIRRDRRAVLATLNMIFPGSMPGEELYRIILDANPEYTRTFLVRDLTYLEEKGYIVVRGLHGLDPVGISVHGCSFRLTAKGTDVANQMVEDTTLDV